MLQRSKSTATVLALMLALIPLLLPSGMALSLCLSSHRLQLHAPGMDACGGCYQASPGEGVEPIASCCSSTGLDAEPAAPGTTTADGDLRSGPGDDCRCCVELTKTVKQPSVPLGSPSASIALALSAPRPAWQAPSPSAPVLEVPRATCPPSPGGTHVVPMLI